jgi:hypothetical protein
MAITTNGKVSITNLQVGSSDDLAGIISDESGTGVLAFTTSPTFTTPALGTPSAVTLTNGTGLPVSGISASTSDAIGVGTIELGHATDTTLARASSGVVTIEGVNVVTTSSTDTITNKSISLATNTVTATLAELNTAVSDADVASIAGSETLTNKTLTAPKFADLGFIADANGNELIILDTVASAVNEVTLANAATTGTPTLTASGGDTDISLDLVAKGTGKVKAGGVDLVTISSTDTLTNKTLTTPVMTNPKITLTYSAKTAAYTADSGDEGGVFSMNNASTIQFNIPTDETFDFAIGTQFNVFWLTGAGQPTIGAVTPGTTTVISTGATSDTPKLRVANAMATCLKIAADSWIVVGDIA